MMQTIKIKGAIFDMDGTLLESLSFWDRLWQSIGQRYFNDERFLPDPSFAKQLRTMIYPNSLSLIAKEYGITDERFMDDYLQFLADFYRYEVSPKKGAVALLSSLREQGIAICLASASKPQNLQVALEVCGLSEYIDSIHSCEDVGVGKERPDVFFKAARSMGLDAGEVCVFEDSFVALETAKAAGFHTVGVYDSHSYEQERLRAASEIYLGADETLDTLIGRIIRQ